MLEGVLYRRRRETDPRCSTGIGGKRSARLIFNTCTGPAINASLIDLGDRSPLVNASIMETRILPKLPVANALWKAQPDLPTASEARSCWRRAPTPPSATR
ncbi:MAG: hypothetical protein ACLR9W_13940 [Enterobacter hormaechei]